MPISQSNVVFSLFLRPEQVNTIVDMASSNPDSTINDGGDADFAQAFQELAQSVHADAKLLTVIYFIRADSFIFSSRGERTAAAMESQLAALEQKIDALLASVDMDTEAASQATNKNEHGAHGDREHK